jgi:hypothetical protein
VNLLGVVYGRHNLGEQISRESKKVDPKRALIAKLVDGGPLHISYAMRSCQIWEERCFAEGFVIDGSLKDKFLVRRSERWDDQDAKEVGSMLCGMLRRRCDVSGDPSIAVRVA